MPHTVAILPSILSADMALRGDHIVPEFLRILNEYVESHYAAAVPVQQAG